MCGLEQPHRLLRHEELTIAAFDRRLLVERGLGLGQNLARITTGATDQAGGQTVTVLEQRLEDMFQGELLMTAAQCVGLTE